MKSVILVIALALTVVSGQESSTTSETPIDSTWAVLIASSNGWMNYRHQADVCHAYQVLRQRGIPEEKIIVFMYDDIAYNKLNKYPGQIFNRPNGPDVYAGVKIDYRGDEVTPEAFLNVLTGNAEGNRGNGTGRVLESNSTDNVFIFLSDHGDTDIIAFPVPDWAHYDSLLHKKDFRQALDIMFEKQMYKQMMIYIETCYSGTMVNDLPSDMNIYAVTAANTHESSYATYFNETLNIYLGDLFSVSWMQDTESHDILFERIGIQVDDVKKLTTGSHVSEWGDLSIRGEEVAVYEGEKEILPVSHDLEFVKELHATAVSSREVPFILALKSMRSQGASEAEIEAKRAEYLQKRAQIDAFMHQAAIDIVKDRELAKTIMTKTIEAKPQHDCHIETLNAFTSLCAPFHRNDYALKFSATLSNLCKTVKDPQPIVAYFQAQCKNGPLFDDVL